MVKQGKNRLLVKFAGGAAAQVLALMNAIYLKERHKKEFSLKYFPYSTGTYWPFAIDFLVKDEEVFSLAGETRGINSDADLEIGKIIRSHPLASKTFSYEKVLSIIRRLKLERLLQKFRGEHAIEGSLKNLERVTKKTKAISGGFVPLLNTNVSKEMDSRFKSAGKKSPFSKSQRSTDSNFVVIHYRMGDKRAKFSHPSDFGGDGIVDPASFRAILGSLNLETNLEIFVVSDEPRIAQKLLATVQVNAKLNPKTGDIWEDIFLMSQAKVFIGSWSQVSQLAAVCNLSNGGRSFLPNTTQVGTKIRWQLKGVDFYKPAFLPSTHSIYSPDFQLDDDAHSSYKATKD